MALLSFSIISKLKSVLSSLITKQIDLINKYI